MTGSISFKERVALCIPGLGEHLTSDFQTEIAIRGKELEAFKQAQALRESPITASPMGESKASSKESLVESPVVQEFSAIDSGSSKASRVQDSPIIEGTPVKPNNEGTPRAICSIPDEKFASDVQKSIEYMEQALTIIRRREQAIKAIACVALSWYVNSLRETSA